LKQIWSSILLIVTKRVMTIPVRPYSMNVSANCNCVFGSPACITKPGTILWNINNYLSS
jgi:hypothetical protein